MCKVAQRLPQTFFPLLYLSFSSRGFSDNDVIRSMNYLHFANDKRFECLKGPNSSCDTLFILFFSCNFNFIRNYSNKKFFALYFFNLSIINNLVWLSLPGKNAYFYYMYKQCVCKCALRIGHLLSLVLELVFLKQTLSKYPGLSGVPDGALVWTHSAKWVSPIYP